LLLSAHLASITPLSICSPFGQGTVFVLQFHYALVLPFFLCAFSGRPALEKETGLFSMLSSACQQYDLEKKIPLKLGLWFIIKSQHGLACFDILVYVARGIMLHQIS